MQDELLDHVDETGKPIKSVAKAEAHAKGLLHKTVIGCLKYGNKWALVQQASDRQDAGQLVAPVGGHVKSGEVEVDALAREVQAEIGVKKFTHRYVGRARFHRQVIGRDENHLMYVYEIETEETVVLGSEAVALEIFTEDEYRELIIEAPERIGDAHWFLLETFYPRFLPKDWEYKWRKHSI